MKKSHTCEEGGAHLFHLFLFGIYWWTWKTIIYLKKLLNWAIKNVRILLFTCCIFHKKIQKNTWGYHYFTPACQKSWWYDLYFLRYRAWQTEFGSFGSFFALLPHLKTKKNQNFENMKKFARDIITLTMSTKNHNHMRYSCWDTEWEGQNFCYFGPFFALLPN